MFPFFTFDYLSLFFSFLKYVELLHDKRVQGDQSVQCIQCI